jgi:ureidoglycolate lyase
MHQLKAKPLTVEGFRKYGVFQNLLDNESLAQNSIRKMGFFPDLITLNFGRDTLPSVCLCNVKKQEKMVVGFLEAHGKTCEGLLPIDADVIIYVGIPARSVDSWSVTDCEAFIVPKGTFVKFEPLILHGTQYPVSADEAHILCMLPERTFNNDMIAKRIENDDDKAEIVL